MTFTKDRVESEKTLLDLVKKYSNEAYYYNSGAPVVIKSVRSLLKTNGIKNKNLINDSFSGY